MKYIFLDEVSEFDKAAFKGAVNGLKNLRKTFTKDVIEELCRKAFPSDETKEKE